jgi:hypothetical protein
MPLVCMRLPLRHDAMRCLCLCLPPGPALAAENRVRRKQLALYRARNVKPRRATPATRIALIGLARWFDWRQGLGIVQPQTLTRWHRQELQVLWWGTSRPGRPCAR